MASKLVRDKSWSPALRSEPIVHFLVNLLFMVAIALLDFTLELIAAAIDDVQIVIGEFAPFLLYFASYLFPVSFDAVPVHFSLHDNAKPMQASFARAAVPLLRSER